jgi:hypothetical protein
MEFSQNRSTNSFTAVNSSNSDDVVTSTIKFTCSNIETSITKRNLTLTTDLKVFMEKKLSNEQQSNNKALKLSNSKKIKTDLQSENNSTINKSLSTSHLSSTRIMTDTGPKWSIKASPKIITSSHSGFNKHNNASYNSNINNTARHNSPLPKSFTRVNESNLSLNYNPSNFSLNSSCANSSTSLAKKKITIEDIKFSINDDQLDELRAIMKDLFEKVVATNFFFF